MTIGTAGPDLRHLQNAASRLWGPCRRWTPGEIAWAYLTEPGEHEVTSYEDGWGWKHPDHLAVVASGPEILADVLSWAGDLPGQVPDGDAVLGEAVRGEGYEELTDAPFDLDLRLSVAEQRLPPCPEAKSCGPLARMTIS